MTSKLSVCIIFTRYFVHLLDSVSDKELAMGREVAGLERRVEALEGGIKQLVEKEKYQRCQVEASSVGRKELNKGQLDNFKQESFGF